MELRAFVEPQLGATYDQQLAAARAAEEAGYAAFFRSDHLLTFAGDGRPGPTDSWLTLGAIARETQTIRLGTMVTSMTFRHPGMLAITVAQADAMSGGRVELGLGTGWFAQEHTAYGIPFPPLAQRFEQLEDQLEIITRLWETPVGEPVTYQGRHHSVRDSPGLPKPVQQPRPPIIIGGAGAKKTPALAARYADEYNAPPTPKTPGGAAELFDRIRQACAAIDRDPATITLSAALTVACGLDEAEASRRAERIGRTLDQLRDGGAAGTVEQVAARLQEYAAVGCQRAYLQFIDLTDLDHIRLVGTEVAAALRDRPADGRTGVG